MKKITIFLLLAFPFLAFAQEFMFQGWAWNYPQLYNGKRYAQLMADKAKGLGDAGFTHVWVPPMSRGSGGSSSMGYDPQDLYDIGQYAGMVRLGTRAQIDRMIDSFSVHGIEAVADMVYNHRDNGKPEYNPAVEGWIRNFSNNGNCPYPSGSFRCFMPIGGNSGNGSGHYYFKFSSATGNVAYTGRKYFVTAWTNKTPISGLSKVENEPNGGGDCLEKNDTLEVGQKIEVTIENGTGCHTDEFLIVLDTANYHATGDTLFINMPNEFLNLGYYTDHRPYSIWSGYHNADIRDSLHYQTYTDFSSQLSGRGGMHWDSFHPNGSPTNLCGDLDAAWFFYDYDQNNATTKDSLFAWTKWMWQDVGVRGMRVDAIKHFPPQFMGDLFDYLHDNGIDPKIAVGEYFDYNAFTLKGWIDAVLAAMDTDTKAAIKPRIFDFPLRKSLKDACDAFGYDVRNVFNESLRDKAGVSGFDVVTFVANHDYDNEGQLIQNNPDLAYAYILTNNQLGVPCVFEKDYYGPPTDTLLNYRAEINALIKVHKNYIYGAQWVDYLSRFSSPYSANIISGYASTSMIYQLGSTISGRDVVVAINFSGDTLKLDQTINTANVQAGDTLTDIHGISPYPYAIVSNTNRIYMQVPPRSFGVWVAGDLTGNLIPINSTTAFENSIVANSQLTVSPNPFKEEIAIQTNGILGKEVNVAIFSIEGKKVYESELPARQNTYSIRPNISISGVYMMCVSIDGKKYWHKIVH